MKKINKLHVFLFILGATILWLANRITSDTLYLCLGIYILAWNNAEDIKF